MHKKITVYVVKAEGHEAQHIYPTKSKATEAVEVLKEFGVAAEIATEKRVVTLA